MADVSRTVVLHALAARTVTGKGPEIVVPSGFNKCRIRVEVTAATGTTPTLDIKIQNGFRIPDSADLDGNPTTGAIEWNDYAGLTQMTAASKVYAGIIEAGTFTNAAQADALAAGTIRNGPFGERWRVSYVIGGTSPSVTFSVAAEFLRDE